MWTSSDREINTSFSREVIREKNVPGGGKGQQQDANTATRVACLWNRRGAGLLQCDKRADGGDEVGEVGRDQVR